MKRITLILGILGLMAPPTALASPRAHISTAHARAAIVRWVGPGTVITKCRRFAPTIVGCDYETPSINVGIESEPGESAGIWSSFATVDRHGVHAAGLE